MVLFYSKLIMLDMKKWFWIDVFNIINIIFLIEVFWIISGKKLCFFRCNNFVYIDLIDYFKIYLLVLCVYCILFYCLVWLGFFYLFGLYVFGIE